MTTSDYFAGFLPILNSRRCRLLDNKRLASQLCALERRPSRVGAKDSIGYPPGGHDGLAASLAGLLVRMVGTRDYQPRTFASPILVREPYTTGGGLPPVIRPELYGNPLLPTGPEYRTADGGDFAHLRWFGTHSAAPSAPAAPKPVPLYVPKHMTVSAVWNSYPKVYTCGPLRWVRDGEQSFAIFAIASKRTCATNHGTDCVIDYPTELKEKEPTT